MKTLYCDEHIIVCIKPAGVVSTDEPGGMPELIRESIGNDAAVRTVHRLDSVVSGLMVYALTKEAAAELTRQIGDGTFGKEYLAVVEGHPAEDKGEYRDYLYEVKRERKTYAAREPGKNAQEAILTYRSCGKTDDLSLVRIKLITGRTHQIRCQFSSRKLPLFGDRKYGSAHGEERIALWSFHLNFRHPVTKETMDFSALPPSKAPWTNFAGFTEQYDEADLAVSFQRSESFLDCPYAKDCGFCAYQGMDYETQLEKKERRLRHRLREIGPVDPILPAEEPFGFRNKVTIDFGTDRNEKLIAGIYSKKAKRILKIGKCRINHPLAETVLAQLRSLLIRYEIAPYEERKKSGWIRQATVRVSSQGKGMLILTCVSEPDKPVYAMLKDLEAACPDITSVILEIRDESGKKVRKQRALKGEAFLSDLRMDQPVKIRPESFFPLNHNQNRKVMETALEEAALCEDERILCISCGSGVLPLAAASYVKKVFAADPSEKLIKEAEERANILGISNVKGVSSEPEVYLEALARSKESIDAVFFEADRCRSVSACIKELGRLKPNRIIYISESTEELPMELKSFMNFGYTVSAVKAVDILPFTDHTEAIVLLTRRK